MQNNFSVVQKHGVTFFVAPIPISFREWLSKVYDVYFNRPNRGTALWTEAEILKSLSQVEQLDAEHLPRIFDFKISRDVLHDAIGITACVCSFLAKLNRTELADLLWKYLKQVTDLGVLDRYDPALLPYIGEEILAGRLATDRGVWSQLLDDGNDPTLFLHSSMALLLVGEERALAHARHVLQSAADLGVDTSVLDLFWSEQHCLLFDLCGHKALSTLTLLSRFNDLLFSKVVESISRLEDGYDLLEGHGLMLPLLEYLAREKISDFAQDYLVEAAALCAWLASKKTKGSLAVGTLEFLLQAIRKLPSDEKARRFELIYSVLTERLQARWLDFTSLDHSAHPHVDDTLVCKILEIVKNTLEGYTLLEKHALYSTLIRFISNDGVGQETLHFIATNPPFVDWLGKMRVSLNWSKVTIDSLLNVIRELPAEQGSKNCSHVLRILSEASFKFFSEMNYRSIFKRLSQVDAAEENVLKKLAEIIDSCFFLENQWESSHQLQQFCARISDFVVSNKLIKRQIFDPFFYKWLKLAGRDESLTSQPLDDLIFESIEKNLPKGVSTGVWIRFAARLATKETQIMRAINLVARALLIKQRNVPAIPNYLIGRLCALPLKSAPNGNQDLLKSILTICRHIKESEDCIPLFRKMLQLMKHYESIPKYKHQDDIISRCIEMGKLLRVWENPEDRELVSTIAGRLKKEIQKSDADALASTKEASKIKEWIFKRSQEAVKGDQDERNHVSSAISGNLRKLLVQRTRSDFELILEILSQANVKFLFRSGPHKTAVMDVLNALIDEEIVLKDLALLDQIVQVLCYYEPAPGNLWRCLFQKASGLTVPSAAEDKESLATERKIIESFALFQEKAGFDLSDHAFIDVRSALFKLTQNLCIGNGYWREVGAGLLFELIEKVPPVVAAEQLGQFLGVYLNILIMNNANQTAHKLDKLLLLYKALYKTKYAKTHAADFASIEIDVFFVMCLNKVVSLSGHVVFKRMITNPHVSENYMPKLLACLNAYMAAACAVPKFLEEGVSIWLTLLEKSLSEGVYNSLACQTLLVKLSAQEKILLPNELIRIITLYLEKDAAKKCPLHPVLMESFILFSNRMFDQKSNPEVDIRALLLMHAQLINFGNARNLFDADSLNAIVEQLANRVLYVLFHDEQALIRDALFFCNAIGVAGLGENDKDLPDLDFEKLRAQINAAMAKQEKFNGCFTRKRIFLGALSCYSRHKIAYFSMNRSAESVFKESEKKLAPLFQGDAFAVPEMVIPLKSHLLAKFNSGFINSLLRYKSIEPATCQLLLLYAWDLVIKFIAENPKNTSDIAKILEAFLLSPLARLPRVEFLHANLCALLVVRMRRLKLPEMLRLKFQLFFDPTSTPESAKSSIGRSVVIDLCHSLFLDPSINILKKAMAIIGNHQISIEQNSLVDSFAQGYFGFIAKFKKDNQIILSLYKEIPKAKEIGRITLSSEDSPFEIRLPTWKSLLIYYEDHYAHSADWAEKQSRFKKFVTTLLAPIRSGWLAVGDPQFVEMRDLYAIQLSTGYELLAAQLALQIDALADLKGSENKVECLKSLTNLDMAMTNLTTISTFPSDIWREAAIGLWFSYINTATKIVGPLKSPADYWSRIIRFFYDGLENRVLSTSPIFILGSLSKILEENHLENCFTLDSCRNTFFEYFLRILMKAKEVEGIQDGLRMALFYKLTAMIIQQGKKPMIISYLILAEELGILAEFDPEGKLSHLYRNGFKI